MKSCLMQRVCENSCGAISTSLLRFLILLHQRPHFHKTLYRKRKVTSTFELELKIEKTLMNMTIHSKSIQENKTIMVDPWQLKNNLGSFVMPNNYLLDSIFYWHLTTI